MWIALGFESLVWLHLCCLRNGPISCGTLRSTLRISGFVFGDEQVLDQGSYFCSTKDSLPSLYFCSRKNWRWRFCNEKNCERLGGEMRVRFEMRIEKAVPTFSPVVFIYNGCLFTSIFFWLFPELFLHVYTAVKGGLQRNDWICLFFCFS